MTTATVTTHHVPPGFRFHPTDEELVNFYLRNKVTQERFDLDHVIKEVDLNKLEPWDLREVCRVDASSHETTEWYFFSHKDKKYPTGTRTNRATLAGFWKATGRDKAVHCSCQHIGMRKTLVFYTGRAPHGQKTDWIITSIGQGGVHSRLRSELRVFIGRAVGFALVIAGEVRPRIDSEVPRLLSTAHLAFLSLFLVITIGQY